MVEEDIKRFGVALKKIRNRKNISQEGLSNRTGVTPFTIRQIEQGNDCKLSTIIKLAHGLKTSVEEIACRAKL